MSLKDKITELQKPFPEADIEWRIGSVNKDKTKGTALAYVTNRAIMQRLDDVFGIDGWQNSFRPWKDKGQICTIGIWDADHDRWLYKEDGAEDTNIEPLKGGLSDAMKRAAVQWGIGRYLYKLPTRWVALKEGRYFAERPSLPKEFLPEGHKSTPTKAEPKQETSQKLCAGCGTSLADNVYKFSMGRFKKPLCRDCQAKEVAKDKSAR
jgi:hypothetical protein